MLNLSTLPYDAQPGFRRTFEKGHLTLGAVFPLESYSGEAPTMLNQTERAREVEAAGFAALWVRDVPLLDPDFGDVGQVFDPFVYLGYIAAHTEHIALGTASTVVPLRNPLHLAKAATSIDQLSGGRLLLGVATGDRPVEFPAFGVDPEQRGELFRDYIDVLRKSQKSRFEVLRWENGLLSGADMIPKPFATEIPLLITGNSQQSIEWIAANGHGWINYPRPPALQEAIIRHWRAVVQQQCGEVFKPFCCSLYIELTDNPNFPPQAIHLGYRLGRHHLSAFLELLREMGVNHVMLNLRFGQRPAKEMIEELAQFVVPQFSARAVTRP